jgi:dynein heavy chain
LGQFDKDYIPDKTIKAIQPFIENPDFVQGNINLASKACVSLWIRAMHTYHFVARSIPKENITTPPKHHHP